MLNRNSIGTGLVGACGGLLITGLLQASIRPIIIMFYPHLTKLQTTNNDVFFARTYCWLISGVCTVLLSAIACNLLILPARRALIITVIFAIIAMVQASGFLVSELLEFGSLTSEIPNKFIQCIKIVRICTIVWYSTGVLIATVCSITVAYIRCMTGRTVLRTTKHIHAPLLPRVDSSNIALPSPQDSDDNWRRESWMFMRAVTCSTPRPNIDIVPIRLQSQCVSPIATVGGTVTPIFYSQCPTICDVNGLTAAYTACPPGCDNSTPTVVGYGKSKVFPQIRKLSYASPDSPNVISGSTIF